MKFRNLQYGNIFTCSNGSEDVFMRIEEVSFNGLSLNALNCSNGKISVAPFQANDEIVLLANNINAYQQHNQEEMPINAASNANANDDEIRNEQDMFRYCL